MARIDCLPTDHKYILQTAAVIGRTNNAWNGRITPAKGGFIPPAMPGHSSNIWLAFNPSKARKQLAEAGYNTGKALPKINWFTHLRQLNVINNLQKQWLKNLGVKISYQQQPTHIFYNNCNY